MARSSSRSQSSVRIRRRATTSFRGGGFSGGRRRIMLYFYTNEASVLRLSPTMVLIMSICFIGFVTGLHIFGKLYRSHTASASM